MHACMRPSAAYHDADFARQGQRGECPVVDALLVQVPDVDLHAGVVLGGDELVGPGAVVGHRGESGTAAKIAAAPVLAAASPLPGDV